MSERSEKQPVDALPPVSSNDNKIYLMSLHKGLHLLLDVPFEHYRMDLDSIELARHRESAYETIEIAFSNFSRELYSFRSGKSEPKRRDNIDNIKSGAIMARDCNPMLQCPV